MFLLPNLNLSFSMNFNLGLVLGLPEDMVEDLGVVIFPEVMGAGPFLLLLIGPFLF